MPVAELQEGDEELPGEPEYIPKIGRCKLASDRHFLPQTPHQIVNRRPRKPSIGLDLHHTPIPLEQPHQRDDVIPMQGYKLRDAGRLLPGALERLKQSVPEGYLVVGEAR